MVAQRRLFDPIATLNPRIRWFAALCRLSLACPPKEVKKLYGRTSPEVVALLNQMSHLFVVTDIVDDESCQLRKTDARCSKPGSVILLSFPPFLFLSRAIFAHSHIRAKSRSSLNHQLSNRRQHLRIKIFRNKNIANWLSCYFFHSFFFFFIIFEILQPIDSKKISFD